MAQASAAAAGNHWTPGTAWGVAVAKLTQYEWKLSTILAGRSRSGSKARPCIDSDTPVLFWSATTVASTCSIVSTARPRRAVTCVAQLATARAPVSLLRRNTADGFAAET